MTKSENQNENEENADNMLFKKYEYNEKDIDDLILEIPDKEFIQLKMMNHLILAMARIEQQLDALRILTSERNINEREK